MWPPALTGPLPMIAGHVAPETPTVDVGDDGCVKLTA